MKILTQKYKSAFSIVILTCFYFVYSSSGFSQEMIVLSSNKILVESNSPEMGLLVLPAQFIYAESTLDLVSISPIEINVQNNNSESDLSVVSFSANASQSEILTVKETKNSKTVSVLLNNQTLSVVVSNKNGSKIENILPVSVAKGQTDHSEIVAVVSDMIFIADGTKLKVSGDLNIYWNQVFNFECNLFSVSSDKNLLTVKLVNGAEFVFDTNSDLTLLSFSPSTKTPGAPFELLSLGRVASTELSFSIVKDLKQFSPICKKQKQIMNVVNETVIAESGTIFNVLHQANLWSPVTGAVYDSESFDFTFTLSDQTYPNFTQPNIQTLNNPGNNFISETQFC